MDDEWEHEESRSFFPHMRWAPRVRGMDGRATTAERNERTQYWCGKVEHNVE